MEYYIIWLIIMVIFLIVEAITMGLTTIWFALGAFAAMILSLFGAALSVQIAIFLIVSIACLIFVYPYVKNKIKPGQIKTNYESVINKIGIVTEKIDNIKAVGQVKVDGQIWTARASKDEEIEVDEKVIINEVHGVKLLVSKITTGEEIK